MKPPPFAYARPATVDEAVHQLRSEDGAMLLAGGQSLVPMLNLRVARPTTIIDISRIAGLDNIEIVDDVVSIGALTTHARLASHGWPASLGALPAGAAKIGYQAIRHRGTIGGSLAHADPAAELPAIAVALDATIHLQTEDHARGVKADDFFEGYYTTARNHDEMVARVTVPLRTGLRSGFAEFSRRAGDFALALAAVATWVQDGTKQARVVVGGLDTRPRRITVIEDALVGDDDWKDLCTPEILSTFTAPFDDIHGTAGFRLRIGAEMVARALTDMTGARQ